MDKVPPALAPKPGCVKVVRAIYSYDARQEDELSFQEGDILYIQQENGTDVNWWTARCSDKTGLIPANYVEENTDTVENPVHDAARRGNLDFLKECLSNGVSPTGLDVAGNIPLHWASRGGHLDCVTTLLAYGTKLNNNPKKFINTQNRLGETPLHVAAAKDQLDVVSLLLANGADSQILSKDNKLPVDLCHDPSVKTQLLTSLLHPNECDRQDGEDYADDSDQD